MTKKTTLLLIIFSFFFELNVSAQNLDTLKLYRNKCGMRYNVYKWSLFYCKAPKEYGYNTRTIQDTIVTSRKRESSYCIFYDRRKRKMYEGPLDNGYFSGTVIFYYKSGKIKKTEIYGIDTVNNCNNSIIWSDAPYETGIWKYYKKSRQLFKQKEYLILLLNITTSSTDYYRVCFSSSIDKNGNIKLRKTTLLEKNKM